ncbi:indolepyruvate ferredoxin oxidoreductase family protein [Aquibium sp. ELW1220]|uniref:indolepyruvate ferredoxin oxidoreductase family protein n=1 Tax=Aquibium sp. ELW1220 TaxID=2976766 RepID=UPI0025AF5159|nr:indolepyruvate ferredoxin oxidoreductase family protein [Aquibium sp. ELW1220]MDN2580423.1 indolepyruvate ferredoxin oxidoreductase family protein [Aquibium sp. ELW1220]
MTLHDVSLDDKFDLGKDRIFVSGAQAIIRMLLMQRDRDRLAGLNTAGFVTGYRGSPLGGLDQQLWKARRQLSSADIVFQPGLNEELAATACWGAQQTELLGEGRYDGVFALWYGKGPGVDRAGDVFRHANLAGSSRHGGVLALMGDDHTAESSTNAHATELQFVDTMIPILNPAGVQEIVDYGLLGYAMSRFAGTWAAMKCVKENIESTASVDVSLERLNIVLPEIDLPAGGLNIRHELDQMGQEARLHNFKRAAASAFIRANGINRIVYSGGADARIGIITIGKSYLDVRQALEDIGIDEARANRLGVRLFKLGCPWPLDFEHLRDFARGLEMIVVVEEKRSLIEAQVREQLYGTGMQPVVVGKRDEHGHTLFQPQGALDPNEIAIALGERVLRVTGHADDIAARVSQLKQFQAMLADTKDVGVRTPYFCSGCPHNSSTKVPEGSLAGAGIGCHFMALWMDRKTVGFTAMGGEGAQWIGQAPFSKREHLFQNLGDGTYNHSGSLAIRFAVASGANITYKILYNDAVAMTGGQPHEGGLSAPMIAEQVRAEGVERIAIVTDEPDKYDALPVPLGATVHHRDDLDAVQRELREVKGVSVLLYDQTCAAEKRRRRKRGTFPDPDKRVIINELVCEGCGDCGVQSNCVSVQPVETEFGRKRRIDQSSCNKDFSCVKGFCPSFVTVHGGKIRKAAGAAGGADPLEGVPAASVADAARGWAAIIDGIGGTGVVTIGAVLGMAAHLEGKGCGLIDMAGLAQKGGAVYSHVRVAATPDDIHAIRVSAGKADLVLGCDLVVSGSKKVLGAVRENHTIFVANTAEVMPGDFARSADFSLPTERLRKAIRSAAGERNAHFFDATRTATALFGNSLGANMFMLGFACQLGGLPVSPQAIEKAIELNGQAVAMNLGAFRWGRRAAHDPEFVRARVAAATSGQGERTLADTLDDIVARRSAFLASYQNRAYAERYERQVAAVRAAEAKARPGSTALTEAVARNLFKAMAIKDEYEVARLYTDGSFAKQVAAQFESVERLEFHLAPPILGRTGSDGKPVKSSFGPWMMSGFRILARLKGLRGTMLDVFGRTEERRMERRLLAEYEQDLALLVRELTAARLEAACALASVPSLVRGFGHVKAANAQKAAAERKRLMERFAQSPEVLQAAE